MLKRPDHKDLRDQINWLAALLDGEGCVYMGISTRKHTTVRVDCWLMVGMTHQPTIEFAAEILRKISGDPCRVSFKPSKSKDRRGYNKRDQWRVSTSSKQGTLNALRALMPFLYTKQLETRLAIRFLERALTSKHYTATKVDHVVVDVVKRLKGGCGEAPAEAMILLGDEVIPNQATQALDGTSRNRVDGLQTTALTAKNNAQHECPTATDGDESVH